MAYRIPITGMTLSQSNIYDRVQAVVDWSLDKPEYFLTRPRWIQFSGRRDSSVDNTDWYGERTVVAYVTMYQGKTALTRNKFTTFIVKGKATVAPSVTEGSIVCYYNFSLSGAPAALAQFVRMEFDIMDSLPYKTISTVGVTYPWFAGCGEYVLYASDRADMTTNVM